MTTGERGGPQVIPRPPRWSAGAPAPWASIPPAERVVTVDALRRAFTGRVGAPSSVESPEAERMREAVARATRRRSRQERDRRLDLEPMTPADPLIPLGAARGSAVLAPIYEEAGELWVVLTRRAWTLRAHTGEVSFPGGAIEPGETPAEAALREADEEVSLDPATVEILGELDHLMTVTSSSFIVPQVALLPGGRPQLTPSPGEVDAVLHVPVAELLRDDVYREERWTFESAPPWVRPEALATGGPAERSIFFFELEGDTLWGATAAMVRHLLAVALGLDVGIEHL